MKNIPDNPVSWKIVFVLISAAFSAAKWLYLLDLFLLKARVSVTKFCIFKQIAGKKFSDWSWYVLQLPESPREPQPQKYLPWRTRVPDWLCYAVSPLYHAGQASLKVQHCLDHSLVGHLGRECAQQSIDFLCGQHAHCDKGLCLPWGSHKLKVESFVGRGPIRRNYEVANSHNVDSLNRVSRRWEGRSQWVKGMKGNEGLKEVKGGVARGYRLELGGIDGMATPSLPCVCKSMCALVRGNITYRQLHQQVLLKLFTGAMVTSSPRQHQLLIIVSM